MRTRILILLIGLFGLLNISFSQTRAQTEASIDSLLPSLSRIQISAIRQAYKKTLDYTENGLNSKVSKVTGKKLTTVDFRVVDSLKLSTIDTKSTYIQVSTYAALTALSTPSVATLFKVATDENKGILNALYMWWPSGKRQWIAATDDN